MSAWWEGSVYLWKLCVCVVDGPALGVYLEVVAGERFFLKVLPW